MDTFQGHYKDGTNGTHDLRFFSGLYLLFRLAVYASTAVTYQTDSYAYATAIVTTAALSVALAQPYKKRKYCAIDSLLLTTIALLYVTLLPLSFTKPVKFQAGLTMINSILIPIPLLYIPTIIVLWMYKHLSQCILTAYQHLMKQVCNIKQKINKRGYEEV